MHADAAHFTICVHAELRDLILAKARRDDSSMSDVVAQVLAAGFDRPDLASVPRAKSGRKLGSKNKRGRAE